MAFQSSKPATSARSRAETPPASSSAAPTLLRGEQRWDNGAVQVGEFAAAAARRCCNWPCLVAAESGRAAEASAGQATAVLGQAALLRRAPEISADASAAGFPGAPTLCRKGAHRRFP